MSSLEFRSSEPLDQAASQVNSGSDSIAREVQNQNRNRDDVEQREQHWISPKFVDDRLTGNYDDKRHNCLVTWFRRRSASTDRVP